ncbi:histidinol-phosphate transaminase, partial [bacterium]|nr:histidinol-phosphate transaminase [bacterium]
MNIENLLRKEVQFIEAYIPSKVTEEIKKELNLDNIINLSTN